MREDMTTSPSGGRATIEGWLLLYVEFTIVIVAMRLLAAYYVYDGDAGLLSLGADFAFYLGSAAVQSLLGLTAAAAVVLRRRAAPRLAVLNEAAAIAAIAANVLAFGAQGENWTLAAGQLAASVGWIAYFLRSDRVRRTFGHEGSHGRRLESTSRSGDR